MMNIDRPLDELVKESRAAKRKVARDRRQKDRDGKKDAVPDKATENGKMDVDASGKDTPAGGALKGRNGGIRKKRRSRGAGGEKAKGDTEVVRKNDRKGGAIVHENENGARGTARKPNKGAKVSVFNLDHGVTQSDIAELFETVGALRSARLIVLQDGRSSGSAEVIFEKMADALEAIRRYNNVPLDNRPLKITLSTDSAPIRLSRGRRGGRRLVIEGGEGSGPRRGDGANGGGNREDRDRDFDASPKKDNDRFADDNDRFGDNERGSYSRRNNRRSRNSRSYDRRGSSPNDNQMYAD